MSKNKKISYNYPHSEFDCMDFFQIHNMTIAEKELLSKQIRDKILESCSKNGGHLSSNLGVVELTVELLNQYHPYFDDIIFDVGHQSYAYKILTGRDILTIRLQSGTSSFQNPKESPLDKISAGHSSTSLSYAYGISKAKQLDRNDTFTICVIGDASLSSGMSYEALDNISQDLSTNFIIVVNINGMSISELTSSKSPWLKIKNSSFYYKHSIRYRNTLNKSKLTRWFYKLTKKAKDSLKRFFIKENIFEAMGFVTHGPIDGHSFKELSNVFEKVKNLKGTHVVLVNTIKGKGYELAENDRLGNFHSVAPFDIKSGKNLNESSLTLTSYVDDLMSRYLEENKNAVIVNPAMVHGSNLDKTFNKYQERTFDVGITEEHAVTFASGLSQQGKNVVVSIYSTFMQRSYDQILHDVARVEKGMLFLVERCGLVGPDGTSHQGIYDVAYLNSIPNTEIVIPYDYHSLERAIFKYDFKSNKARFIRIVRDSIDDKRVFIPEDEIISNNSENLLISCGPYSYDLFLCLNNFDNYLIFNLNKLGEVLLKKNLSKYKNIVLVDIYSTSKGTSSYLLEILNKANYKNNYLTFSLPHDYIEQGTIKEQLERCKLDISSVIKEISKNIG